ncbi:MAG: TetR family transcriptional regulator [Actinomycetota bacterium]
MRTAKAQATRDRLLDVATRLFADRGYEGTSIEGVLAEAGVSRGALYHHFPSKEALFEAVYSAAQARVAQEVIEGAAGASNPVEMIRAGTRAWLDRVRDPIVRQITLIDAPAVLGWRRWREIDEEHFLGTIKLAMQEAGGSDASPTRVELLAHMYLGMVVEVAMMIARGDRSDESVAEAAAEVDSLIARMFD